MFSIITIRDYVQLHVRRKTFLFLFPKGLNVLVMFVGAAAWRAVRRSGDRITVAEVLTLGGQTPTPSYIFTPKLDNSWYTSRHYHNPRQCHGRLAIAIVLRHRARLHRIRVRRTRNVMPCHS